VVEAEDISSGVKVVESAAQTVLVLKNSTSPKSNIEANANFLLIIKASIHTKKTF
jgi:hypothetical protein